MLSLLISVLAMNTYAATAKTEQNCSSVIKACDAALEAKNKALQSKNESLDKTTAALDKTIKEKEADQKTLSAWYHNPFIMAGLGAVTAFNPIIGLGALLGIIVVPKP